MRSAHYARNGESRVLARGRMADGVIFVLLAGLLLLSAAAVQASDRSMRCGKHLIHAGGGSNSALQYEVLKKCGEPAAQSGDSWIYYQGSMVRHLTFNHQGRLQTIESRKK